MAWFYSFLYRALSLSIGYLTKVQHCSKCHRQCILTKDLRIIMVRLFVEFTLYCRQWVIADVALWINTVLFLIYWMTKVHWQNNHWNNTWRSNYQYDQHNGVTVKSNFAETFSTIKSIINSIKLGFLVFLRQQIV